MDSESDYIGGRMDFQRLVQIIKSLDDGALEPDEAADVVELMGEALKQIRPMIKLFWLRIALDGCQVALNELHEHLEQKAEN